MPDKAAHILASDRQGVRSVYRNQYSPVRRYPVSTVFSGMWHNSEVDQNTAVLRKPLPLTAPEQQWLAEAKNILDRQYCRLCYRCKSCPEEIPVISILSLPLYYHRDGLDRLISARKGKEKILSYLDKIDSCTNCNVCADSCPHGLPIPGGKNWSGKITWYRYHVEDPVYFEKRIMVTIEHGHANHRSDDYSSTAYWYQTEPHKPFKTLPKVVERIPRK